MIIIICAFWFGQYVHIPYQISFLQSLGYEDGLIGIVVGAYGFTQVLLRIPFGVMADHAGKHRNIILGGLLVVITAQLIRIFVPTLVGFLIANLLSGIGASAWISYMVLFMSYYDASELQKASGLVLAANNTGVFLGFLVSSFTFALLGMRFLCICAVVVGVLALIVGSGLTENEAMAKEQTKTLSVKELLRPGIYKRLFFFALLALLQQGVQMATVMSFTVKVVKRLGGEGWQIGMSSIVYIVFAVIFSKVSTYPFFSRIGYRIIVPVGLAMQMLYCILVPNLGSIYAVYACQLLASSALGFLFTSLTSESMKGIPANQSSTAMGIFQAVYAVGMTTVPILVGQVAEAASLDAAYYTMAAMLGVGTIVAFIFYKKEK